MESGVGVVGEEELWMGGGWQPAVMVMSHKLLGVNVFDK